MDAPPLGGQIASSSLRPPQAATTKAAASHTSQRRNQDLVSKEWVICGCAIEPNLSWAQRSQKDQSGCPLSADSGGGRIRGGCGFGGRALGPESVPFDFLGGARAPPPPQLQPQPKRARAPNAPPPAGRNRQN